MSFYSSSPRQTRRIAAAIGDSDDALWSNVIGSAAVPAGNIGTNAVDPIGKDAARRQSALPPPTPSNACTLLVSDAVDFLSKYNWRGDEFVYCDPPYLQETRTSRHRYLFELSKLDHVALLELLARIPSAVMVSGYSSELYFDMLAGWRVLTFEAITRSGSLRTEYLWCNYDEPIELHDYRYLGHNFRARQDLNRMRKRWIAKLEKMPLLKQRALLSALREVHARHITARSIPLFPFAR